MRARAHQGRAAGVAALILATIVGFVGGVLPAQAQGDEVGGSGNQFFLTNSTGPLADVQFAYGTTTDRVYVGDWNDDDVDTLAVRRGNVYHVRNALSGGPADQTLTFGRSTDLALSGDWDGDGDDTLAIRRGNVYLIKNTLSGGAADASFTYGRVSDIVVVGDWDGDGDDALGVRRGNVTYVKDDLGSGPADRQIAFGRAGDAIMTGDWNADTRDTLGVRRSPCAFFGTTADQASGPNPFENLSTISGRSMRVGAHPCFDRVVFEFRGDGPVPGWTARYVDVIRNEETGQPVEPPIQGTAYIDVHFGAWFTGEPLGQPPFEGPTRIVTTDFRGLREARVLGGFESISELGIGVDRVRPFRVIWLEDPVRLVIDIYTG
jgi:hypothetical protein